jgi:tetrahydromethanopterin S-methyltransferase subunit G
MMKKSPFWIGVIVGLFLMCIWFLAGVWVWQRMDKWVIPPAQSVPPMQSNQPADLPELTSRVQKLENDVAFTLRDIAWRMDQKLLILGWAALGISFLAGIVGIKTYNDLDKTIRERVMAVLDKALYELDPTMLNIWIRKEDGMEKIWRRLELSGLQNLHWFTDYGKKNLKGVSIVPVKNTDDETEYMKAVKSLKPESSQAAFILYAPQKGYFVDAKTLDAYENSATANMPSTVINAILAVGRGLKAELPVEK